MTTPPQHHEPDHTASRETSSRTETGVGDRTRRVGGLVLGTAALLGGLRRRSIGGLAIAVVGAGVLTRTLRGGGDRDRTDSSRDEQSGRRVDHAAAPTVSRSLTVDASADDLYEAWRDPVVFARVMDHFADVTSIDEDSHHWVVRGPGGVEASWETRVVEDDPGQLVRWETTGDARVPNGGSVRFRPAPDDRGTLVTLTLAMDPPGGAVGNALLDRLGVLPETLAGDALGRFKSLVESGEVPTLEGNPSGRGTGDRL